MKLYAATVHLLINATSRGVAVDTLNSLLTETGMWPRGDHVLWDWSFISEQAGDAWPKAIELPDDFFDQNETEREDAGLPSVTDIVEREADAPMGDLIRAMQRAEEDFFHAQSELVVAWTGVREAARVRVAAPKLLSALKAMLDAQSARRHPLGMPDEGIAVQCAEAASLARAAIAEAERAS